MTFLSLALYVLLLIITIILLIVAGVYATRSAVQVTKMPNYDKDGDLQQAHKFLTWAAVVTWVSVGLAVIAVIILIIAGVFFGPEEAAAGAAAEEATLLETQKGLGGIGKTANFIVIAAMLGTAALALTVGGLSAAAAIRINKSPNSDSTPGKDAYKYATIAAITGIGGIGLIIIGFAIYFIVRAQQKKKQRELTQKIALYRVEQSQGLGGAGLGAGLGAGALGAGLGASSTASTSALLQRQQALLQAQQAQQVRLQQIRNQAAGYQQQLAQQQQRLAQLRAQYAAAPQRR
jgi:amino acid transporter